MLFDAPADHSRISSAWALNGGALASQAAGGGGVQPLWPTERNGQAWTWQQAHARD
jgi:hypothetical protein